MSKNKEGFLIENINIYILYTGGTIGMGYEKGKGLIPIKGLLTKLFKDLAIKKNLNINYNLERTNKLIDSSNLKVNDWYNILKKLFINYSKYDAFIVLHGTDTLAYTASALSFFLRYWDKSVIFTGSQIPLFEYRNDATRNIINSIIVSLYKIPERMIVFGDKILRGNLSSKLDSRGFNAFDSPNEVPIGKIDVHIELNNRVITKTFKDNSTINMARNWNLDNWKFHNINIYEMVLLPVYDNSIILRSLININPSAIIIRSFGIGNASTDYNFLQELLRAKKKKIILVNNTQCIKGGVEMDYYRTGQQLKKHGVISSYSMTPEAVYGKLYYLFQILQDKNKETRYNIVKKIMTSNIAGEIPFSKLQKNRNIIKNFFKKYQEI